MSKISELGSITGANTRTEDLFVIVNLVQGDDGTKNITRKELVQAIQYEIFDRITITGGSITGTTIFENIINDNVMNDNEFNRGSVNDTDINRADIDDSSFDNGTANNVEITNSSFDFGTMETVSGNNVTLINSFIDESEITNTSFANGTIDESEITNSSFANGVIEDSTANNLIITDSDFSNGSLRDSTGENLDISESLFSNGTILDTVANNMTITNSILSNNELYDSFANNIDIDNSEFNDGVIGNSDANNITITTSTFSDGQIFDSTANNITIENSAFNNGTGNNNVFANTTIDRGLIKDSVIANSSFTGELTDITLNDAIISSSTMSNTGISESRMEGGSIEQTDISNANIKNSELADFDMDLTKAFEPRIEEDSYFALKNVKTGETERITYRQFFDEISRSTAKALKVHVEASSGDDRNPGTVLQPVRTLERGAEIALEKAGGVYSRNDVNNAVHISCGPGTYYTKGGVALPDDCSLTSTSGQYATVIEALPGYEFNNAVLVGSGCYVQGFSYTNWKVDNFDFPEGGFAIAYRPGAKMRRSPYIRDSSQLSNFLRADVEPPLQPFNSKGTLADLGREIFMEVGHAGDFIEFDEVTFGSGATGVISWDLDVATEDRIYVRNLKGDINVGDTIISESGGTGNIAVIGIDDFPNPLVGRGGGCVLADRRVLDPDSLYTYILTFGFTPRTQNGIGYVARDGAGVNGIGSLSIFTRCAFYALNGGQVTLNNSGTQFGDISMRAKGTTTFYAPKDTATPITSLMGGGNTAFGDTILSNANNIIDDMVDYLTSNTASGGLGYQGYDAEKCYRDSGIIIDKIGQDIQTGSNYWGRLSGITYRSPISYVVPGEQLTETLGANRYLQGKIEGIFSNANSEILDRANTSYDELLNILENGEEYASPIIWTEVSNNEVSNEYTAARKQLQDNRSFIQDELIDWIEDNDEFFAYNSVTCRRDTQDYILPAVKYDMLLDTNYNSVTAGNAYYMNAAAKVINNQRDETIASYKRLKEQTNEVIDGVSILGSQRADVAFDNIIDALEEKRYTYSPTHVEYDPISGLMEVTVGLHRLEVDQKVVIETDSITFECVPNKGFITHPRTTDPVANRLLPIIEVTETTFTVMAGNAGGYLGIHSFVSADADCVRLEENCWTPSGSTYDPVSGETLIAFDVNHNIKVGDMIEIAPGGLTYSCANSATLEIIEISHPRQSDKWYKNALQVESVTPKTITFNSGDAGGYTGVHAYQRTLDNAVQVVARGITFSDAPTLSADKKNARKQLQANRKYIQDYMLGWIDTNFFIYSSDKCLRDVQEYILPAVNQDMILGTNFNSVQTGIAYHTNNAKEVISDQLPETVGSVKELKRQVSSLASAKYTPTTGTYDPLSGETVLTIGQHDIEVGDSIKLAPEALVFSCVNTATSDVVEISHPRPADPLNDRPIPITAVTVNTITFNSGDAGGYTGAHTWVSGRGDGVHLLANDSSVTMKTDAAFDEITHIMNGSGRAYTPTTATYNGVTGEMVITIGTHSLTTDDKVLLAPNSFQFECDQGIKSHPNRTDPLYKKPMQILATGLTTITVNPGSAGSYTQPHTFYKADENAVSVYYDVRKKTYTPTTATYDPATGDMVVTVGVHNLELGQYIEMEEESIVFTCALDSNVTEHAYPRKTDPWNKKPVKIKAATETTFTINVGGYAGGTAHTFVSAAEGCIRDDVVWFSDPAMYKEFKTPEGVAYNTATGIMSMTITGHGLSAGQRVELMPGSFTFTCGSDNNLQEISHPRPADPPYRTPLAITATPDINTIQVNVGVGQGGIHTFIRCADNALAILRSNTDEVNTATTLQKNRAFLANEVVGYLRDTYFIYDSAKCERDTGLMLDAVKRDVLTGSNYNAVFSGLAYRSGTVGANAVVEEQLTQTTGAFTWLKGEVSSNLTGTARTRAEASFDELIDIITNGTGAADAINFGDSYVSNDALNTRGILQSNKAFLQAEVTAWLNINHPNSESVGVKCPRDVGYLVDSVSYDIQHGSNVASINNAKVYFENAITVLPYNQRRPTAEAFQHIANVAKKLARNETVTPTTGNVETPVAWTNVEYTPIDAIYNPVSGIMKIDLGAAHSFAIGDYMIFEPESITLSCGDPVTNIVHPRTTDPAYEKPHKILAVTANTITMDVGDAGGYEEEHTFVSATANAVKKYFSDFMGQRVEDLINIVSDSVEDEQLNLPPVVEPNDIGTPFYESAAKGTIVGGGSTAREAVVRGGSGGIDGAQSGLLSYNVGGPEMDDPSYKFSPFEFGPGETGYAQEFKDASSLINGLTEKLQTEITTYINEQYNGIGFVESKCIRDSGYLIDAVTEDLLYGGNEATVKAARAYFINSINLLPSYQYDATSAAFTHLAASAESVVLENTVTPHFGPSAFTPTDADYNVAQGTLKLDIGTHALQVGDYIWFDENALTFSCANTATGVVTQISHPRPTDPAFEKPTKITQVDGDFITVTGYTIPDGYAGAHTFVSAVSNSVKEVTGNILKQDKSGTAASVQTAQRVQDLITVIANIADDRTNENIPAIADAPTYNPLRTFARDQIAANRKFLIEEVVAYLNDEYFTYDGDKCFRDTGYIIDAVRRDLITGSNFNSVYAGASYRTSTAGTNAIRWGELSETVGGVRYIQSELEKLVTNEEARLLVKSAFDTLVDGMAKGYTPTGVDYDPTSGFMDITIGEHDFVQGEYIMFSPESITLSCVNTATSDVIELAHPRISDVNVYEKKQLIVAVTDSTITVNVGNAGGYTSTHTFVRADEQAVRKIKTIDYSDGTNNFIDGKGKNARINLQLNKSFLAAEATAFIALTYPSLSYDVAKCERDVGHLVDAISFDLQHGGNTAALSNARLYFEGAGSVLPAGQRAQTAAVFQRLAEFADNCVQNIANTPSLGNAVAQDVSGVATDAATGARAETLMEIVAEAIAADNLEGLPASVEPKTSVYATEGTLLKTKTPTMQSAILGHIAQEFNGLAYKEDKCRRDMGAIIDGIAHDIQYDGNSATHKNAMIYFENAINILPLGQREPTRRAFMHLGETIETVLTRTDVTPTIQKGVKYTPTGATYDPQSGIFTVNVGVNHKFNVGDGALFATNGITFSCGVPSVNISHPRPVDPWFNKPVEIIAVSDDTITMQVGKVERYVGVHTFVSAVNDAVQMVQGNLVHQDKRHLPAVYPERKDLMGYALDLAMIVANAVDDTDVSNIPARISPDVSWTPTNYLDAKSLIQDNSVALANEIVDYVSREWNGLSFPRNKCRRDMGFLIDATSHDVQYQTNHASRISAQIYFENGVSVLPQDTRRQTADVYNTMKVLMGNIVQEIDTQNTTFTTTAQDFSGTAAGVTEGTEVQNLIGIVEDVIREDSLAPIPALVEPNMTWIGGDLQDAFDQIEESKVELADDLIHFINTEFNVLDYNKSKCRRDTGYLIDAFSYDLNYGGNTASRWNAEFYFWNSVYRIPEDQREATAKSYRQLGVICADILQGEYEGQVVKADTATEAESTKVKELAGMFYLSQINKDVKELQTLIAPDYDWVEKPFRDAADILLSKRGPLQYDTVRFVNATYKFIDINLTRRDAGNLLQTIVNDVKFINPNTNQRGSTKATRTFSQSFFDQKGQHVFPVFNSTTSGLSFKGVVPDISARNALQSDPNVSLKKNHAYIVSTDTNVNFYAGTIYYWNGSAWIDDGANNTDLLYAFYATWDRIRDFIIANYSPDALHSSFIEILFNECLKDNILRPNVLTFGSLVESIAHQFNGGAAGVNRTALPLNFRNLGPATSAISSVLSEDGGRVRWSGADELNNQYFARGLRINGRTGRIEGRPFTSSVRKLARRASNSRAVV